MSAQPTAHVVKSIRVLPPEVAARIAAGEVIERPVSVVRELLDNAIDAGSSRISLETGARCSGGPPQLAATCVRVPP